MGPGFSQEVRAWFRWLPLGVGCIVCWAIPRACEAAFSVSLFCCYYCPSGAICAFGDVVGGASPPWAAILSPSCSPTVVLHETRVAFGLLFSILALSGGAQVGAEKVEQRCHHRRHDFRVQQQVRRSFEEHLPVPDWTLGGCLRFVASYAYRALLLCCFGAQVSFTSHVSCATGRGGMLWARPSPART